MNSTATNRVKVESGGQGVVAHVGLHALGSVADALGLGEALSSRLDYANERAPRHDRGKVLVQMALALAGGGESCADVEHLRAQVDPFGDVPSDSTVYRTFHEFDADQRGEFARALASVRQKVWAKLDTTGEPVILDFDASLVMGLAESKERAASTYKGGFGFRPLFCFSDLTGETLSHTLRPGNATAHNAADHVEVLDAALAQLPGSIRAGHGVGDEFTPSRQVIARRQRGLHLRILGGVPGPQGQLLGDRPRQRPVTERSLRRCPVARTCGDPRSLKTAQRVVEPVSLR